MKNQIQSIAEFYKIFDNAKMKLEKLASELKATNFSYSFTYKEDENENSFRCHVRLSFGQYGHYSFGSFINKTHLWDEAEKTLRQYYKEWKTREEKRDEYESIQAEKERIYNEYLNNKK